MKLSKQQRAAVRDKYAGKCAYCGCELGDKWHADHLEAIYRSVRYRYTEGGAIMRDHNNEPVLDRYIIRPEHDNIDNMVPACMSCNIHKSTMSLEHFREDIAKQIDRLRRDKPTFRLAERYGLIECKPVERVTFYFETL